MKSYYDVLKFLRRFGLFTYLGNKEAEIDLTVIELKSLKHEGIISDHDYYVCLSILNQEKAELKNNKG